MRQLKIEKHVTNRDSLSLNKYLYEIGKVALITTEEEIVLANKIKYGDKQALEELIKANLRFVVSVAKQYQNRGLSLSDLIAEGNLGLIRAAQRYDETRGFKFITYSVWWIRQSILQALAEHACLIRIPLNKIGAITRINKALNRFEQEFQREPTTEEIAAILKISPRIVEDALSIFTHNIEIDASIPGKDDGESLYDVLKDENSLSPDKGLIYASLCKDIERALSTLDDREANVIRYYFGLCGCSQLTMEEISHELGITKERVRQIKENTIKKMKNHYRNNFLRAYL
jgi:RNA polymerase primary sigma factor